MPITVRSPRRAPALCLAALLATVLALAASGSAARAETSVVSVPAAIEFPLLRHLLISQLFPNADGSREILNDPRECNRIILSQPDIGAAGAELEITARVQAQLGIDVFGKCLDLINWKGGVVFLGRPAVQPDARSIRLAPQKTWLVGDDGDRILSGRLWDAGNTALKSFFGSFLLDLTPQLESLGTLLPEVLPHRSAQQLQATIASLTPNNLRVNARGLDLAVNFEIEALAEAAPAAATEFTPQELLALESQWQMMDALLVGAVKHYAAATRLQALRSELLDILIDSRYRLRDVLTQTPSRDNDAVRDWFIDSWHQLNPVVRSIAEEQDGQEQLLWFSAVTASDALYALNQLGSTIGLEISTEGLRRLAKMINAGQVDELLRYSEDVDPALQQLLRQDIDSAPPDVSAARLTFSLFARAHADSPAASIKQWLPVKGEIGSYLPRVEGLLEQAADKTLQRHELQAAHRETYEKLVLATAWQESCWRQFVVVNKRIEPLRSSTGDVGLMQVNERVWRGFYDLQKLRWDIGYNGRAGSEILLEYLVKYALKRGEHNQPGGLPNLARASYSAYNGGPGQVARYRNAKAPALNRKVDSSFWEKYRQVDAGNARNVAYCLGEDPGGPRA